MKRFAMVFLVCLFLLSPSAARASASSPTAGTIATSGGSLTVRSAPSASGAAVGSLPNGGAVTLYEKSGSWRRVGLPGGKIGYCSSGYIREIAGSAAKTVSAGGLNVRSGPSLSHPVAAVLPRWTVVVRISGSGDFAKIVYDGTRTGYVSAAHLASPGGSSTASTYAAVSLKVPSYRQTDGRWASVLVGNSGRTIADIGCTVASLAMTESYRTGAAVTPDVMEGRLSYSSGGAVYWPDNYTLPGSVSYRQLYDKLKAGIPVIVGARRADGGTHFVVVKGFLGGDSLTASGFAINDPGSGSRTTLQQFLSAYPTVFRRAYYTK